MAALCAVAVLTVPVAVSAQPARGAGSLKSLLTRAERTDYVETSRYEDVMAFVKAVSDGAKGMHLTTFGYTFEGRALPLVVVGDVKDGTPDAVRASGKLRVYIQANIHGGEVEGKEAMQMLLRALAAGERKGWADALVLLVAPIYNADGNERVAVNNRPRQLGPVGGMGQRPNAQGFDLNRDHMKLDSPEARSVAALMTRYDPHVALDLHTTNGTRHAYHLTYAPPLNPNTDRAIIDLLRMEWLPWLTKSVKTKHGWDWYYYGNLPGPATAAGSGAKRGWVTFDHRPRFNNNYIGLRNRVAILSEAYAYLPFRERVQVTRRFVEENLDFARQHADRIRKLIQEADTRSIVGQTLAVRATVQESEAVEILLGDVAEELNPYTGIMMFRRLDVRKPERMPEFGTFKATDTETVPSVYYVPANLTGVIDRLAGHGVRVLRLEQPRTVKVEEFAIASNQQAERPFEQHRERTLTGSYRAAERNLPAGTVVVPMDQPLARLVFYLLEPRSDDGFLNWNVLDDSLKDAAVYPIMRGR